MGSLGVASTEIILPVWSRDEIRKHQGEDDLKTVIDCLQNKLLFLTGVHLVPVGNSSLCGPNEGTWC